MKKTIIQRLNQLYRSRFFMAATIVLISIMGYVLLVKKYESDYKSLETDFKAIQSTIKAKDIEILQWQKYGSQWRYRADSLDKEILNNQHIRYVNKVKYIKVLSAIDSITDDGINEYYSTGKVPN